MKIKIILSIIIALFLTIATHAQTTYYVKVDATGTNNGASWNNAFNLLQDALDAATADDQIWVAQGTYYPTKIPEGYSGERAKTFALKEGVRLYGGFKGNETDVSQRTAKALSGDALSILTSSNPANPSYHIVVADPNGFDRETIVDGFQISGGNADAEGTENQFGGGIVLSRNTLLSNTIVSDNGGEIGAGIFLYNGGTVDGCLIENNISVHKGGGLFANGTAVVKNTTIKNNQASHSGGGICFEEITSGTISNCTIDNNQAQSYGGGVCFRESSNVRLIDCSVTNNQATELGGGVYNIGSTVSITHTLIVGNTALKNGGGMYNHQSEVSVNRCTFDNNTATDNGGSMYNSSTSQPTIVSTVFKNHSGTAKGAAIYNYQAPASIINCLFTANESTLSGGAIHNYEAAAEIINCTFYANATGVNGGGAIFNSSTTPQPVVANSIFWNNQKEGVVNVVEADIRKGDPAKITYCLTQENSMFSTGTGMINNQDPLFVDVANADFHLLAGSPLINSGNDAAVSSGNTSDIEGNARIQKDNVDIGAYESSYLPTNRVVVASGKFRVYPVPTTHLLYLDVPSHTTSIQLSISNITGKRVIQQKTSDNQIDVINLPAGVYTISIVIDKKVYRARFIKK